MEILCLWAPAVQLCAESNRNVKISPLTIRSTCLLPQSSYTHHMQTDKLTPPSDFTSSCVGVESLQTTVRDTRHFIFATLHKNVCTKLGLTHSSIYSLSAICCTLCLHNTWPAYTARTLLLSPVLLLFFFLGNPTSYTWKTTHISIPHQGRAAQ